MSLTTQDAPGPAMDFEISGGGTLRLSDFRLVVAGYTGRDRHAVDEHIRELAAIGVPAPASVPSFFELDPRLVTQESDLVVNGTNTSGEVEPVLVRSSGRIYLGVGSDHTDRDIERDDIARSKAACVKPVSRTLVEVDEGVDWDAIILESTVDGRPYQHGALATLRVPTDVLALLDQQSDQPDDLIMFGGTVPVSGGTFIPGSEWSVRLALPGDVELQHSYRVSVTTEGNA